MPNRKSQALSILVIDDDPLSRNLVANIISGLGHSIDCISSIRDIELSTLFKYDVCILDLMMPEIDGIECLRLLNTAGASTRLIILSEMPERVIHLAKNTAIAYGQHVIATSSKPPKPQEIKRALILAAATESALTGYENRPHRLFTIEEIRAAMINGEFVVHLQPQVELRTGSWYGLEALARWQSLEHGLITPACFIEQVENSKLALPFTMMIIEQSIMAAMKLTRTAGFKGTLSVNMPPYIMNNVQLADQILNVLKRHSFPAGRLMLEFTERSLPENLAIANDIQARLTMRGIKLSIDDFGTGHSSMDRLRQTHFNEIKIDAAFIDNIFDDIDTAHIVKNILNLSKNLNMTSVAEGIENQDTLLWLRENGCQIGQGFHICKPGSTEEIMDWALHRTAQGNRWQENHIDNGTPEMIRPN